MVALFCTNLSVASNKLVISRFYKLLNINPLQIEACFYIRKTVVYCLKTPCFSWKKHRFTPSKALLYVI